MPLGSFGSQFKAAVSAKLHEIMGRSPAPFALVLPSVAGLERYGVEKDVLGKRQLVLNPKAKLDKEFFTLCGDNDITVFDTPSVSQGLPLAASARK